MDNYGTELAYRSEKNRINSMLCDGRKLRARFSDELYVLYIVKERERTKKQVRNVCDILSHTVPNCQPIFMACSLTAFIKGILK